MIMTNTKAMRSLWPYSIAVFFIIALCGIAAFVTWAVRQNMDLVRADYYEHEILFQKQIDAVNRTRPFANEVAVTYALDRQALALRVPSAHVGAQMSGQAHLYRPSNAKLYQHVDLQPARDGTQRIDAARLAPGLWKVRLNWNANGESFTFEQNIVIGG